jgi:L-rhamnose isomerase
MKCLEELFEYACRYYSKYGVDVIKTFKVLEKIPLSIHAWQGDDVTGFENTNHALTGGCMVTGNYPGRARNSVELRSDLDMALSLIPGKHRVCLQGHQVDKMLPGVDRDRFSIENFSDWLNWAKTKGIGLDIAPAFYSHPKLEHGFSLSHPDSEIRRFWINHGKAIRRIGEKFGQELGTPTVCNFWVPDGFKDIPADRESPRGRLCEALDEIFADAIDEEYLLDAVESKLFGIGTEAYTVGSHDFYLTYASKHNKLICLDSGHFHPTESVADKISSIRSQQGRILLHVSRGVRWDSDHVLILNDELLAIAHEITAYNNFDKVYIGLDYFDASINRIAAWVIGARNMLKALLIGLLEPKREIRELEKNWDLSRRLAMQEEIKSLPWGIIWSYYCKKNSVPEDFNFMNHIYRYEEMVLSNRI